MTTKTNSGLTAHEREAYGIGNGLTIQSVVVEVRACHRSLSEYATRAHRFTEA